MPGFNLTAVQRMNFLTYSFCSSPVMFSSCCSTNDYADRVVTVHHPQLAQRASIVNVHHLIDSLTFYLMLMPPHNVFGTCMLSPSAFQGCRDWEPVVLSFIDKNFITPSLATVRLFFLLLGGLPFTNNVGRIRRQWARAGMCE